MHKSEFSDAELLRYSRQIMLPQVDVAGQLAITNGRVLVVGVGGLGSPVALYLAAAGVGSLVLMDFDQVELSNLQRQIAHTQASIGINKALSAVSAIQQLNSNTQVTPITDPADETNLIALVRDADVVVDCSDNFATRQLVNRACWLEKTPLVSGAAIRFEGQLAVFDPRSESSPCYQCLFPEVPDEQLTCSQSGVLSPVVGVIGSLQAVETLKLLGSFGEPSIGRLQVYDALTCVWKSLSFPRDPSCPCCANKAC